MIFLALLFILLIIFLIWCQLQKAKYKSLKDIPGPRPYPVIGNVFEFGLNSVDFLENLLTLSRSYKPTAKIWLGPNIFYLVTTDPELMGCILNSPKYVKKSIVYENFRGFFHNGLLTAEENLWWKRRKILNPAFHMKLLEGFNTTLRDQTDVLIEILNNNLDDKDMDINVFIAKFSADVIVGTSMGVDTELQKGEFEGFHEMTLSTGNILMRRIFSTWRRFDFLFKFTSDYRNMTKIFKEGEVLTRSIVDRRRQKLSNNNQKEEEPEAEDDDLGMKKRKVYLDLLLTSKIDGKSLSNEDVLEEVNTAIVAGYETSSLMISFTLYELARNPDIQNKVLAEVREIFNDDPNYRPTFQDYSKMKYTELVLKESLRLYSPVPFVARQLAEDAEFNGTTIPKDTNIIFFFYGMHRRDDLFENAEKFDPDRFTSGRASEHPFAFLPFSLGPRNCIGLKFAMYEGKCALARILMNFEVLPAAKKYDLKLATQLVLKPIPGLFVQLRKRQLD